MLFFFRCWLKWSLWERKKESGKRRVWIVWWNWADVKTIFSTLTEQKMREEEVTEIELFPKLACLTWLVFGDLLLRDIRIDDEKDREKQREEKMSQMSTCSTSNRKLNFHFYFSSSFFVVVLCFICSSAKSSLSVSLFFPENKLKSF